MMKYLWPLLDLRPVFSFLRPIYSDHQNNDVNVPELIPSFFILKLLDNGQGHTKNVLIFNRTKVYCANWIKQTPFNSFKFINCVWFKF